MASALIELENISVRFGDEEVLTKVSLSIKEAENFVTPILIHDQPEPKGERQLLINLSASVPLFFAQFDRVIELVTEDNRSQARERYSYYKERGYALKHITL